MRLIYDKISNEIIKVIEDGNSITAFPENLGVIQGDLGTVATIAALIGLDVSQIPGINMTPELRQVLKKRKKGQDILNRFLAENEQLQISAEQNIAQLSAMVNVKQMLESGALATARQMIANIPGEVFLVTPGYESGEHRKQTYLEEIDTYIADL
jgi:hypothetical protein